MAAAESVVLLPVDRVQPDPHNPRRVFDNDALDQLAESITTWGQLQPVVVRPVGDAYQLICGERRWRAHQRAGLPTIWAVQREATDHAALAMSLVENLHRVDLSHAEKVAGLDQLAEIAQAQGLRKTAQQLHMDPSWLSRQLSVRRDPIIFPALEAGRVGFGHAAELCRAPQARKQDLLDRIASAQGRVSMTTLRAWVEEARRATPGNAQVGPASAKDEYHLLLVRVDQIGPPRSPAERASLTRLVQRAQQLLATPHPSTAVVRAPRAFKQTLVEVACLMCAERVATIVNGKLVAARHGSIRGRGCRIVCGRCGGSLATDSRTDTYRYDSAARA